MKEKLIFFIKNTFTILSLLIILKFFFKITQLIIGFFKKYFKLIVTTLSFVVLVMLFTVLCLMLIGFTKGKESGEFTKSKSKIVLPNQLNYKLKSVQGIDEAKDEIEEIIDFLKYPKKYKEIGAKMPKGFLLYGPPGTGKTMLAKAIASEANVPFLSISGSDFVEMFVGVGASRVRDLFSKAKKIAPAIIFIDEIDAVGRKRGSGYGGGNDEREQTLNQLLVEMDGFEENIGIIVIAATNRLDVLDNALLRPGRFDRKIQIRLPDVKGREEILKVHALKVKTEKDVNLNIIAKGTAGFSGADLEALVNEGAISSAKKGLKKVTQNALQDSIDKIMLGSQLKGVLIKKSEKTLTAYHEGGHALAAYITKGKDSIQKATIIPRGYALGFVSHTQEEGKVSQTYQELKNDLVVAMAGRAAEEFKFGKNNITTGAKSDIQQATKIAKAMVSEWGYSERLGKVSYDKNTSPEYRKIADEEIKNILNNSYDEAKNILDKNKDKLEILANSLLEHETLTGSQIHSLLTKGKI